jgi:hypothetical protein
MTDTEALPPLTMAARRILYLEKQNRKLNDRLNRYRNVTPGRKRLISLGRIAAHLEYEADEMYGANEPTFEGYDAMNAKRIADSIRADALFLRRLEWDFEQLIDVVWKPKQDRRVWPRP